MNSMPRIRRLARRSLLVVFFVSPFLYGQAPHTTKTSTPRTDPQPAGMFDLQAARLYESLHRWKEAEQEYLQAGRIGAPSVKKEALAAIERLKVHQAPDDENFEFELGKLYEDSHRWKEAEQHYTAAAKDSSVKKEALVAIERLKAHRAADDENFEFELGKLYEDSHRWKEAEQHYTAAAKDAPKTVRDLALADVTRVRQHRWVEEKVEDLDHILGYAARILGAAFLFVVLRRILKRRRAIEVMAFEAPKDEASKRVVFTLSSARDELPELLAPVLAAAGMNVVDFVPLIILPGLENEFPDPAEDVEVGEIKLPLANWVRLTNRPIIRVFGRWKVGETTGTVNARIMRRRFPSAYRESRFSQSDVNSAPGDIQDQQLMLFGYDVLVKAIFSRLYGP